jgi:drug/metabolite transporter (DMT)-like permease
MIKYLTTVNVNGTNAAFYSCVFAGVIGLIGSLVTVIIDPDFFDGVTWFQLTFTMLIGFFISFGQVFINLAVSKGNAAISAAILHTKTVWVVLFNLFV